jgi:hypothetical protein
VSSSKKSKALKFLDPNEITTAINEIAALAQRSHVAIALAGGAAMQVHGSDRFTKDVDFIADHVPIGLRGDESMLSFGGVSALSPGGVPVDVIVRDDDQHDVYMHALEHADEYDDLPMRVVSAEWMIPLKMLAGRGKDLQDLEFLLLDAEDCDLKRARKIVKDEIGLYGVREFDALLVELKWKRSLETK